MNVSNIQPTTTYTTHFITEASLRKAILSWIEAFSLVVCNIMHVTKIQWPTLYSKNINYFQFLFNQRYGLVATISVQSAMSQHDFPLDWYLRQDDIETIKHSMVDDEKMAATKSHIHFEEWLFQMLFGCSLCLRRNKEPGCKHRNRHCSLKC